MATGTKRPHAQALADAEAFKALFPADSYKRWEFAGSLRRGRPEVADVEHVVIPCFDEYGRSLLWKAADSMVASDTGLFQFPGRFRKHIYGDTGHRWGEKYRGCDFRDFNHEIFTATPNNWGCVLLIRTGPAEFGERFVTALKHGGIYRQDEGYLHGPGGEIVPVPDERTYFALAGMNYVEPEARR